MHVMEAILSRRSIRKFTPEPIPDELLMSLLKAAMYAPSARNTQAWNFIVVRNKSRLMALAEIHPYAKMLQSADSAILVCGNLAKEPEVPYLLQNCSAATQNILLAAHDSGLGSVWLGIQPREDRILEMGRFFKLPESLVPISLVALGFPDESFPVPERNWKSCIARETWPLQ